MSFQQPKLCKRDSVFLCFHGLDSVMRKSHPPLSKGARSFSGFIRLWLFMPSPQFAEILKPINSAFSACKIKLEGKINRAIYWLVLEKGYMLEPKIF